MGLHSVGRDINPGGDVGAAEVRRKVAEHLPLASGKRLHDGAGLVGGRTRNAPLGLGDQLGQVRLWAAGEYDTEQGKDLWCFLQERTHKALGSARFHRPAQSVVGA